MRGFARPYLGDPQSILVCKVLENYVEKTAFKLRHAFGSPSHDRSQMIAVAAHGCELADKSIPVHEPNVALPEGRRPRKSTLMRLTLSSAVEALASRSSRYSRPGTRSTSPSGREKAHIRKRCRSRSCLFLPTPRERPPG